MDQSPRRARSARGWSPKKKQGRNPEHRAPGRRGQTKGPANGSRRQDQMPEAPTRPTQRAHTPKADKPGIQETFTAFEEQHTSGTSALLVCVLRYYCLSYLPRHRPHSLIRERTYRVLSGSLDGNWSSRSPHARRKVCCAEQRTEEPKRPRDNRCNEDSVNVSPRDQEEFPRTLRSV